ncbi:MULTISPECIES: helix-turn-helix domain-containing protein [unclassified Saccharibacter]|uniref:helix-turn-helix domain-containing protein n=1 Tax=unclassified Saccharibacter TaxID=2648722 RepID=UPI001326E61C|nr:MULTISPECIES: helix-turn-helix transcriptional regulator [unclassified Saccharibacter]MXV35789.1 helix-turn-helix domain-containing protein [Saccharibacter sp. EH611]MXV57910.1 helix-turn-helix domain-containing protein [Saccharibacter sp. EH70]MXV66305.1 helix-turn-helix domain-containing protein [Saccharibacter sp. EH60]
MIDSKTLQQTISDRLRKQRREKAVHMGCKLTQADVSAAVGISRPHLAAAEAGHANVSLETIAKLADFYEVSLDYLVGFSVSPFQPLGDSIQAQEEAALTRAWRAMTSGEKRALMEFLSHFGRENAA